MPKWKQASCRWVDAWPLPPTRASGHARHALRLFFCCVWCSAAFGHLSQAPAPSAVLCLTCAPTSLCQSPSAREEIRYRLPSPSMPSTLYMNRSFLPPHCTPRTGFPSHRHTKEPSFLQSLDGLPTTHPDPPFILTPTPMPSHRTHPTLASCIGKSPRPHPAAPSAYILAPPRPHEPAIPSCLPSTCATAPLQPCCQQFPT